MQIVHLFYSTEAGFSNHGHLYFWVESSHTLNAYPIYDKTQYPYQLSETELRQVANELLGESGKPTFKRLQMFIPCNKTAKPIPSASIANIHNLSDRDIYTFKPLTINSLQLNHSVAALKQLQFHSHYFDRHRQLAADTCFWLAITHALSHAIQLDQYIPELLATQETGKPVIYHTKWRLISAECQQSIQKNLLHMPHSAYVGGKLHYDKETVLAHYADNTLNQLIALTPKTQKLHKLVEGTYIHEALTLSKTTAHEDTWKKCRLWRNLLSYEQFGAPFQLCFRLNAAQKSNGDDWSLEILMQSKEEPSFIVNATDYWRTQKQKKEIYNKMFGTSAQKTLLLQLGYASRVVPLIELFFNYKMECTHLPLSTTEAYQFLKEDAWTLKASGYKIIVPAWWSHKGKLKAKIKLRAKQKNTSEGETPKSYFDQSTLVQFDYQRAIGHHEVSAAEWQELIESSASLVYFRGEWIEIDTQEMQKIQSLIDTANQTNEIGTIKDLLIKAADDERYDVELDDHIQKIIDQLSGKTKLTILKSPKTLKATLRPYQLRGLSWMAYLEQIGLSPCLADDMGLGKTMQVLALLLAQPGAAPALLVAPTSVIGNWEREIKKFTPSLKTMIHHGNNRSTSKKAFNDINLVITSFGLCRRDHTIFQQHTWSRIIIDEAQNIKNPSAAQTKAICKLKAASRIALTGTPIENRLTDLWSIFHFLNPGYLGTKAYFKRAYEMPVQRDNNPYQTNLLKKLVEPFILRRVKTDKNIIKDLPDKIEQKVYCQLTKEQASIYQNIVDDVKEKMAQAETKQDEKALMLSTLLRLKQTCNHPAQILQDGSEFSVNRSMKLKRLVDIVSEVITNQESILIFSQFTEICNQLSDYLRIQHAYNTYYLHGGTSRTQRETMIEAFQHEDTPPSIFILSLKAGGVGITLTKANHVIHFDRWWNPAVENQATDRAYRIGQQKTVFAHKFVTTGTIEERIDQMLEDKQKVSDSIIGQDESWISQLDSTSFLDLIKLSQEEIAEDIEALEAEEYEVDYDNA